MADISFTAANIVLASGSSTNYLNRTYYAGATITQGQAVALDGQSTPQWQLADVDADETGILAGINGFGIALSGASAGQPITVAQSGSEIDGWTTVLTEGMPYCISATAGGIAPISDLVSGNWCVILGFGTSTGSLKMLSWFPTLDLGADIT